MIYDLTISLNNLVPNADAHGTSQQLTDDGVVWLQSGW